MDRETRNFLLVVGAFTILGIIFLYLNLHTTPNKITIDDKWWIHTTRYTKDVTRTRTSCTTTNGKTSCSTESYVDTVTVCEFHTTNTTLPVYPSEELCSRKYEDIRVFVEWLVRYHYEEDRDRHISGVKEQEWLCVEVGDYLIAHTNIFHKIRGLECMN